MAPPHRRLLRRILKVLAIVVGVLLVAGIALYQVFPYRGIDPSSADPLPWDAPLTRTQATADLDEAWASIRDRHMSTVHGVPPALQQRYDEARAGIPEQPTVLDVWRATSRLANALGDAHSGVNPRLGNPTEARFAFDGTTLTVVGAGTPEVTALNGVPVADLWRRYLDLASYEGRDAAAYDFAWRVRYEPWLRLLGAAAADGVTATTASGGLALPTRPATQGDAPPPEVRFEGDLAILVLHDCTPGPEYTAALATLFDGARERGLTKLVVDLRDNGGGNSAVANEFLTHLDLTTHRVGGEQQRWGPFVFGSPGSSVTNARVAQPYGGRVYVLTSGATFSSAVMFTWLLQDNGAATVVGQPPGNHPNSYGDVIPLRLTNSRLRWIMTYKLFTRANGDTDPTKPLQPDVVTAVGDELAAVRLA